MRSSHGTRTGDGHCYTKLFVGAEKHGCRFHFSIFYLSSFANASMAGCVYLLSQLNFVCMT